MHGRQATVRIRLRRARVLGGLGYTCSSGRPWAGAGPNAFIAREGDTLVTDSRAVALAFGKRHKNVLQTIEKKRASRRPMIAQHAGLNFQPGAYADENGQHRPMYRMTAEGMTELAMSFTGDKTRVIRIRFINAFEAVTALLARAERSLVVQLHALELKNDLEGQERAAHHLQEAFRDRRGGQ